MEAIINKIDNIWDIRNNNHSAKEITDFISIIDQVLSNLNNGTIRVAEKVSNEWQVNQWIKKAILLSFKFKPNKTFNENSELKYFDKIPLKFEHYSDANFLENNFRIVPGAIARYSAYIAKNVILMPSFINVGAYIDEGTLIDAWATVGSCAQIGKNCHISGGVGIGGVLEPLQTNPVIIEDNVFIGARSEVAEGVIIEQGSVLSMGVYIGLSTRIYDRESGKIIYGKVPAYSVVVPGTLPSSDGKTNTYAVIIVKKVDEKTRLKTSLNDLLRY